jgi:uncharacterized protein YjdB
MILASAARFSFGRKLGSLLVLASLSAGAACSGEAVELSADGTALEPAITISGGVEVEVGHSLSLLASTTGAEDSGYSWRTGDDRIATVDGRGMITALYAGKVTITVTGRDSGLSAGRDVTVTDANQAGP